MYPAPHATIRLLAAALVAACSDDGATTREPPAALVQAPTSTAEALLRDSAAADSSALAALPAPQQPDFDILGQISREALGDSVTAYCQPMSDSTEAEVRKRLRGHWPPGYITVLFVRADRATGALQRVELVRRPPDAIQRGWIWDNDSRRTTAVEWKAGQRTPETFTLPEGTPTPRALRALGRRLLVLPCTGVPPERR